MGYWIAGFILPCLAAHALVKRLLGDCEPGAGGVMLRIGLAVGLGLGLSSCSYFLWLWLAGVPDGKFIAVEGALFAGVALLGRVAATEGSSLPREGSRGDDARGFTRGLLAAGFGVALAGAVCVFVLALWTLPNGCWDAWDMWNIKARLFFRSPADWQQAASAGGHDYGWPGYPLLISAANARLWVWLGSDATWVPWFVAGCFTFSTVAVLMASLSMLQSGGQALLAGMALLGLAGFVEQGTWQIADVPLGYFMLAAIALLALHDAGKCRGRGPVALAAACATLAAWTKNEGVAFLAVLFVIRATVLLRCGGRTRVSGELMLWALGALPVGAVLAAFKICLAPPEHLFAPQTLERLVACWADPSRHAEIAAAFGRLVVARHAWMLLLVLPLCGLLLGWSRQPANRRTLAGWVVGIMVAVYYATYVITPDDLRWQLSVSLTRLFMQLWPLLVFTLFLSWAPVEEIGAKAASERA